MKKLALGKLDPDSEAPRKEHVTDTSFIKVFSQMRLRQFSIFSSRPLRHVRIFLLLKSLNKFKIIVLPCLLCLPVFSLNLKQKLTLSDFRSPIKELEAYWMVHLARQLKCSPSTVGHWNVWKMKNLSCWRKNLNATHLS